MINDIYQEYLKTNDTPSVIKLGKKNNLSYKKMMRLFKENNLLRKSEIKIKEINSRTKKKKSKRTLLAISKLEKNNIKHLYEKGFSTTEISKLYKKSRETIAKILFREFKVIPVKQGFKVNEDFFDCIDSEIKAYLLGFFFADGCIEKDTKRFGLCNSIDDIEIIKLFQKYICPEAEIKITINSKGALNRKPQCVFRWSSKYMAESIEKLYNLKSRKTYYNLEFPNISEKFQKDFIRGYFDGDGSILIQYYSKGGIPSSTANFIANNISFIDNLCKIFDNNNIEYRKTTKISKNNYILYCLIIHGKKTVNLFNYLYKDATIFLDRKYQKFLTYIDKGNTEINLELKKSKSS